MANNDLARVLVVEDEEAIRQVLYPFLQEAGFDVIAATSGREALQILGQNPPDAVVLDLDLGDNLGKLVLDYLRDGEDNKPAWVTISAASREVTTRSYGPLGGHFLPEPFDPWDLISILTKSLQTKWESTYSVVRGSK